MSRTSQGPYLKRRKDRYKDGKLYQKAVWVIRNGKSEVSTGCPALKTQLKPPKEAQTALATYIANQYDPRNTSNDIKEIDISDVLLVYVNHKIDADKADEEKTAEERHFEQALGRLNEHFGGKMLSDINTNLCKGYVKHRIQNGGGQGGARRDLEVLRAAVNFHGKENLHYGTVNVWLPEKGEARDRWLERSEAAKMLWAAWRYREIQTIHVGPNKGQQVITDRRPLRHVARFLLIGFYTGTRAGAIASASKVRAPGKSYVDLDRGMYYRKPIGKKATKKRQPPAPIPPRLLTHMRRWDRLGIAKEHFVEWNGKPVLSVKKAFRTVVKLSKVDLTIGPVTPHTLRHTAATWLMLAGTNLWVAAGYLGMTVEVLERVYGHHHPDYQAEAVENITSKRPKKKVAA